VRQSRATQRKDRKRAPVPNAAIVGYTNSGKSSLLRRLTGANVLIEDKLFATLDTTTRKIALPSKQPLLLTDTVGFVRKLPHRLVEAFNATLEEAALSDFLIHLLDASQPEALEFYNTTMRVLTELGADEKRMLVALNKIDKVADPAVLAGLRRHFPEAIFISVYTGEGLSALVERMDDMTAEGSVALTLRIPQSEGGLLSRIHRHARVLQTDYEGDAVRLIAVLPARLAETCAEFVLNDTQIKLAVSAHSLETR